MTTGSDLIDRALAAHFRACAREGLIADQQANDSGLVNVGDNRYVVLRSVKGVTRVYRVRYDGILRELRRWPAEIGLPSLPNATTTPRRKRSR